jgi:hypothetical protein
MAASTGPAENNTIAIQQVELGDTFNLWRDVTNTATYKINKLKIYDATTTSSIAASISTGGTLSLDLSDNVTKGLTFQQPILFNSGVTFNGPVTFNAETVTLNANIVTIDDYNLVLGDTAAGSSDAKIDAAGGGGLYINRGSGGTAEWLWQTTQVHGITGVWRANSHIGFSGATSGIYPHSGGSLRVHGSGLQIDGGSTSDHGVMFNLTSTGVAGTTSGRTIEFSRYSPSGSTAFIRVLNGSTYGSQPFVNIPSGANRKRVTQTGHGFSFGMPVYINSTGAMYTIADCTSTEAAEVVGVVSDIIDANTFDLTFIGEIFGNFSNALLNASATLTPGAVYYLSSSAGKLNLTPANRSGQVHKAVFIASGTNSAVVLPFTGGLLAEDVQIITATTVGTTINQHNKFRVGDALRFKNGSSGLSYAYTGIAGHTYATYTDGIYVKSQANSEAEAEVIGIVTSVSPIILGAVDTKVNYRFTMATNGYMSVGVGGICASNGGVEGNMVAGVQYFLNTDCAGTTQALEDDTSPSFTDTPPSLVGRVRKPIAFSVSTTGAQLINYRGDINNSGQYPFTGYTGSSPDFTDMPIGSIVMGTTGSTLSPNTGVTLYYHNSGALDGEYGVYLNTSATGTRINGTWKTRGRAIDRSGAGVTAYHLCQRIS